MSAQNTNEEINTKALDDSMSNGGSSDNLNESMTVVGIEMQSTLVVDTNESESTPANVPLSECDSIQNLRPSTSAASDSASSSSTSLSSGGESLDNSGDEGIGEEPESSTSSSAASNHDECGFRAIDLQPKIKVAVADELLLIDLKAEEEADADTLSPLVIDNHVYVEHCEMMKHANREIPGGYDDDNEEEEEEEEEFGAVTKDSFSSTDSDVSPTGHNADDANKDSGCDLQNNTTNNKSNSSDEDAPIEIPDDDFCERIVEQVEFYFSDESLLKDAFLLKHVRRNKEGFVSLKLVSSFKRVRALTKDWRVVGIAIKRKSTKIELNDVETKIRRLEPLPVHDETMPSRTVVATNLPCAKLTIERVYEIFAKCGEIALVRILRPNCSIPADVRQFVNKHPELQQNECALVEFVESAAARKAQQMHGIVVFELVLPKKKTGKKAPVNVTKMLESFKYATESENERSRGGENILAARFHLKRNNSGPQFMRSEIFTPARKMSLGNGENVYTPPMFVPSSQHEQQQIYEIPARRNSNCSPIQSERKFSNCSDGYSSCSEALSRRQSMCSDVQRRLSNCSESIQSRRSSLGCVDYCSCGSRRMSQYSNASSELSSSPFRRMSNSSVNDFQRKFSAGSMGIRKYSNASSIGGGVMQGDNRRMSYDRRSSSGGFDPMRKLSQTSDYYINGRKVSTDSGYDRRLSINSITYDNENPITRSRNNSLVLCHQNHVVSEQPLIRKPLGPDPDSKGFGARTRKIGLINVAPDGNAVMSP